MPQLLGLGGSDPSVDYTQSPEQQQIYQMLLPTIASMFGFAPTTPGVTGTTGGTGGVNPALLQGGNIGQAPLPVIPTSPTATYSPSPDPGGGGNTGPSQYNPAGVSNFTGINIGGGGGGGGGTGGGGGGGNIGTSAYEYTGDPWGGWGLPDAYDPLQGLPSQTQGPTVGDPWDTSGVPRPTLGPTVGNAPGIPQWNNLDPYGTGQVNLPGGYDVTQANVPGAYNIPQLNTPSAIGVPGEINMPTAPAPTGEWYNSLSPEVMAGVWSPYEDAANRLGDQMGVAGQAGGTRGGLTGTAGATFSDFYQGAGQQVGLDAWNMTAPGLMREFDATVADRERVARDQFGANQQQYNAQRLANESMFGAQVGANRDVFGAQVGANQNFAAAQNAANRDLFGAQVGASTLEYESERDAQRDAWMNEMLGQQTMQGQQYASDQQQYLLEQNANQALWNQQNLSDMTGYQAGLDANQAQWGAQQASNNQLWNYQNQMDVMGYGGQQTLNQNIWNAQNQQNAFPYQSAVSMLGGTYPQPVVNPGSDPFGDFMGTATQAALIYGALSSEVLKDNIEPMESPIEKIEAIRGVDFDWKNTGEHDVGVIAEEVEKVIPEAVTEIGGIKHVYYHKIIPLLIESIKAQQAQINALK